MGVSRCSIHIYIKHSMGYKNYSHDTYYDSMVNIRHIERAKADTFIWPTCVQLMCDVRSSYAILLVIFPSSMH